MKIALHNLFMLPNDKRTACEVDDELQFHIEMLERKYAQLGMSAARAKAAALQRFGNVERVKKQCVDISRRNSPLRRVLKILAIVIAVTGFVIQTLSSDYKVARIGGMLIMIAVFGRLLLYVRGLKPWSFFPGTKRTFLTDTPDDGART
jgi:hypothetical protein